ncbi:hypothetical protein CFK39_01255 [Brachybacterium avium]|uniref:Uncharacterized protein n=1 Tax=Brachybacterium avium TaxID=2017485 RepID=A0A220UAA6_9MICO|nr:hypothetical protein [Brachybacterium avium]ASK64693.1 hypothetical protein CFK39_01255 [Brachybacterium avium]
MEDEQGAQRLEREQVLSEYGTWRLTGDEDAPVAEEIRTLETLLRLKAEQQGSPDPGLWTEELAIELLTVVVPRTVIQPREHVMDLVPTLIRFVTYLRETGRWHPGAMSATEAPGMLSGLEFAALEAADDPSRRSFSTNILGYGMALGVDLEDEDELAAFMNWYNSLPDDERLALSETGRIERPQTPYDRDASLRAAQAEDQGTSSWPWFLPGPEAAEGTVLIEGALTEDAAVYAANDFVERAAALLEHLGGQPRKVTGTGALNRADSAEVLEALGMRPSLRTMWERPELAGPWVTLLDGGWLEVTSGMVHPLAGPVPYVPLAAGGEGFVEFGHALLSACLFGKDARDAQDGGFRGMPDTIAALLVACGPEGLVMPDLLSPDAAELPVPLDPSTGEWDRAELHRLVAVTRDLDDLVDLGILHRHGRHHTGSAAVLAALVALMKERGEQSGFSLG